MGSLSPSPKKGSQTLCSSGGGMTATILRSACVYSVDNECVTVQERERAKGGNDDEKERKKAAQLPPHPPSLPALEQYCHGAEK